MFEIEDSGDAAAMAGVLDDDDAAMAGVLDDDDDF